MRKLKVIAASILAVLASGASAAPYAVVSTGGTVLNLVQWDGASSYNVSPNTLVATNGNPAAQVGGTYSAGTFTAPSNTTAQTPFTVSGCSSSVMVGLSASKGLIRLGANNCSVVVTVGAGLSSTSGWTCQAHDRTSPTTTIGGESSSTSTTATFSIPPGAGTTDVIGFSCTDLSL